MSNPPPTPPLSILFICLGNICRSPMAEGVFTHLTSLPPYTSSISPPLISRIDSCGTGAYHLNSPADPRTLSTLTAHSITYTCRARKLSDSDFDTFDFMFVMDAMNLEDVLDRRRRLVGRGGGRGKARVMLFGEFAGPRRWEELVGGEREGSGVVIEEVDDPYYGGEEGFDIAYEQCVRFSRNFLECVFPEG